MQEKGRDGGSAAGSDLRRVIADAWATVNAVLLAGQRAYAGSPLSAVDEMELEAMLRNTRDSLGSVLGREDDALKKLTDRSVNSDRWMVGDEDCPPVLKLLDEFREGMLGMIPASFDEQRVILDTKLLKVREMVKKLEEEADRNDPLGCHPLD